VTKKSQKNLQNKEKHEVVLKNGEAQIIQNAGGTYILVKVPMVQEDGYHAHPNHALTVKSVEKELTHLSEAIQEGEHDTHLQMKYDNMAEKPNKEDS